MARPPIAPLPSKTTKRGAVPGSAPQDHSEGKTPCFSRPPHSDGEGEAIAALPSWPAPCVRWLLDDPRRGPFQRPPGDHPAAFPFASRRFLTHAHGLMVKRHHTCLARRSSGFEIPSVHRAAEAERVRRLASDQQDGVRVPAAAPGVRSPRGEAPVLGTGQCGFESRRTYGAPFVQWSGHPAFTREIAGSNPVRGTAP